MYGTSVWDSIYANVRMQRRILLGRQEEPYLDLVKMTNVHSLDEGSWWWTVVFTHHRDWLLRYFLDSQKQSGVTSTCFRATKSQSTHCTQAWVQRPVAKAAATKMEVNTFFSDDYIEHIQICILHCTHSIQSWLYLKYEADDRKRKYVHKECGRGLWQMSESSRFRTILQRLWRRP